MTGGNVSVSSYALECIKSSIAGCIHCRYSDGQRRRWLNIRVVHWLNYSSLCCFIACRLATLWEKFLINSTSCVVCLTLVQELSTQTQEFYAKNLLYY